MSPGGAWALGLCAAGVVALGQALGSPVLLPALGLGALLAARRWRGVQAGLWRWQVLAALVALGCALGPLLFGVPWGLAQAALLLFLAVHRARVGTGARDERLLLILGALMILLASVRARSPVVGLAFGVLIAGLPLGLMCTEVEGQYGPGARLPLGWRGQLRLGLSMGVLSAGLFLFIPRLNAQALVEYGERLNQVGFDADGMDLGGLGALMDNPELVFRARVSDSAGRALRGPWYFRGLALDEFDGRHWRSSLPSDRTLRVRRPEEDLGGTPEGQLRQTLQLEPLDAPPLFVLPGVERMYTEERVLMDVAQSLRVEGPPRRRELVVLSSAQEAAAGLGRSGRLPPGYGRGLPADLDPRVPALARELAGEEGSARVRAQRLSAALQARYRYTEVPRAGLGGQPLTDFLFTTREGHCEFFATALAVMLRAVDIPAVVVVGFYGGEWNEVGGYLAVRQQDAHAWVEARMGDGTWLRLDATPVGAEPAPARSRAGQAADWLLSQWHSAVLGYDLDDQLDAARAVAGVLSPGFDAGSPLVAAPAAGAVVLVYALGIGALVVVLRGVQRGSAAAPQRPSPEERAHRQARALVARRGWALPRHLPAVAAARWLQAQAGADAAPLVELAELASAARYGPGSRPAQAARSRELLHALRGLGRPPPEDRG